MPEVGAGWHEVYVIGERGAGRARVIGPDGTVVFESVVFEFGDQGEDTPDYQPPPPDEEGEWEEPYAGFEQPVHLEEGTHQVVCIPTDGVESSVSLLVKPARPGYQDTP